MWRTSYSRSRGNCKRECGFQATGETDLDTMGIFFQNDIKLSMPLWRCYFLFIHICVKLDLYYSDSDTDRQSNRVGQIRFTLEFIVLRRLWVLKTIHRQKSIMCFIVFEAFHITSLCVEPISDQSQPRDIRKMTV